MLNCPNAYYKKTNNYDREMIFCKKTNDTCVYTRYCNRLNQIIPTEKMGECIMNKEEQIPKGASKVRTTVSNEKELYVDIETPKGIFTNVLKNPFKNGEIPDYVFVEETIDGYKIKNNRRKK